MPTSAPDFDMIMMMELPRLLTLVAATLLLRLGHTRGGIGELRALAEVRLDAADGTLDGFAHIAKIELNAVGEEKTYNLRTIPRRVWNTHIREAQRRIGTEVGTGGYLQTWMVFDFGVLAIVFALMMVPFVWRALEQYRADGAPPDAVELRNTLYYVTISWALMSFPFLVFHIPIIGVALSTPCATGYSTLGVLVPLLSSTAIIKKEELQAQRKAEREALEKRWSTGRWWHDSTARRVTRAVADVLNPFDNFVNVKQII